jgi:hypothetical protein
MGRYKGVGNDEVKNLTLYERILLYSTLENGHLIWRGSMEKGDYPIFHFFLEGKTKRIPVRRYLFMREYAVSEPWVYNKCGEDRCVLPAHQYNSRRRGKFQVRQRRAKEVKRLRVNLVKDLKVKGFKPEEISQGLGLNLATVARILNQLD